MIIVRELTNFGAERLSEPSGDVHLVGFLCRTLWHLLLAPRQGKSGLMELVLHFIPECHAPQAAFYRLIYGMHSVQSAYDRYRILPALLA